MTKKKTFPKKKTEVNTGVLETVVKAEENFEVPPMPKKENPFAPNPFNKTYRMLDGKHRIDKMLSQGITKSLFYLLDLNEIIPYTELRK